MNTMGIHHLGIAVEDLDAALRLYRDTLGMRLKRTEELPDRGLEVAVIDGGGAELELLASVREDSVIGRFIARRGAGIHHVALRVSDIDAALAELRGRGVRLVDQAARPGAGGTRVAFVHPEAGQGVLIELVEEGRA